jgi:hypothetical protein
MEYTDIEEDEEDAKKNIKKAPKNQMTFKNRNELADALEEIYQSK